MKSDDTYEQPTMTCPACGVEELDYDGFGLLSHSKLGYPDTGCGWCSHPSTYDGKCGCCGAPRPWTEKP